MGWIQWCRSPDLGQYPLNLQITEWEYRYEYRSFTSSIAMACAFPLPFTASLKEHVFLELVFFELVLEHPPRKRRLMMMVKSVVML